MASAPRPLVVTADGTLLDDILGVAAVAGIPVDVAVDLAAARPQWMVAPLVMVGYDVAPSLASAGLRLRTGVLLVGSGPPPEHPDDGATPTVAEEVVGLPGGEERLMTRLAEIAEPDRAALTFGLVSGRGGAGASTLAAALALTAADRAGPAWLVDLDPFGGGADSALGAELTPGVRWPDLAGTVGRLSSRALRDAVPTVGGVSIVSCDSRTADGPEPSAVVSVVGAARRGGGTVVLDLPRQPTPARQQAVTVADHVVVVVPADVRGVLAARQVVSGLESTQQRVDAIVRRVAAGLSPAEVARGLGLALVGVMDEDPSVRSAGLVGSVEDLTRSETLARLCAALLDPSTAYGGRAA